MLLNCSVGEDSWESLGLQGDPASSSSRRSVLSVHWKDRCWSWNSITLATWWEELTHWKRPCCWERLRAREEATEDEMVGWHQWHDGHEWVNSGSWWWIGSPGVLQSMGLQRVGHDWTTEKNWSASFAFCRMPYNWNCTTCSPLWWAFFTRQYGCNVPPWLFMACIYKCKHASCLWLFAAPWTVVHQASVHEIFQTRILEWFPFPSPGDLLDPGIKSVSPALQADSLPLSHLWSSFWLDIAVNLIPTLKSK